MEDAGKQAKSTKSRFGQEHPGFRRVDPAPRRWLDKVADRPPLGGDATGESPPSPTPDGPFRGRSEFTRN
jgi:hypothetical protein